MQWSPLCNLARIPIMTSYAALLSTQGTSKEDRTVLISYCVYDIHFLFGHVRARKERLPTASNQRTHPAGVTQWCLFPEGLPCRAGLIQHIRRIAGNHGREPFHMALLEFGLRSTDRPPYYQSRDPSPNSSNAYGVPRVLNSHVCNGDT